MKCNVLRNLAHSRPTSTLIPVHHVQCPFRRLCDLRSESGREEMKTFNFNRSYFRFRIDARQQPAITVTHAMPTTVNNVRINIECRCALVHLGTGKSEEFVLGASCKTERVGVDRDCWLQPNADFCLAASDSEFLILKSWARNKMPLARSRGAAGGPLERQSGSSREAWTDFSYALSPAEGRALDGIEHIIAAIRGDRPLVAHTEYDDGDYRVVLDYPIKTINYSERERVYQTDTGPILLPNLSPDRLLATERQVECFDLAYAAFNSSGWAEFIVNVPTEIGDGIATDHYSLTRRIEPVRNTVIEVLNEAHVPPPHISRDGHSEDVPTERPSRTLLADGSARTSSGE